MKILVIGQPRSRSNWLLDSLATHHNIENLQEPYYGANQKNAQLYASTIRQATLKLVVNKSSFACKLQTSDIMGSFYNFFPLIGFSGFNFSIFDSIYITYRQNIAEQLSSLIVAKETGEYTFSKFSLPTSPNFGSIKFDPIKHQEQILELAMNHLKIRMIKRFLRLIDKPYEEIEYQDCPTWINDNLPMANSIHVETNFDYKSIISNYNEIPDFMEAVVGKID
jgi:hypothetical protein